MVDTTFHAFVILSVLDEGEPVARSASGRNLSKLRVAGGSGLVKGAKCPRPSLPVPFDSCPGEGCRMAQAVGP
eukprot:5890101-Heterocapsa_arctica.AAC.1